MIRMIVESIDSSEIRFFGASETQKPTDLLIGSTQDRLSDFKRFIYLENTHQKSAQVHVLYIKHLFKYIGM
jgi:hypothetical protein